MNRKAHYLVTHTEIEKFTASSEALQVSINKAILGPMPERILIALVENIVFVDSVSINALHFHHFDTTNLVLYVNAVQHRPESHNGLLFALWSYQSL